MLMTSMVLSRSALLESMRYRYEDERDRPYHGIPIALRLCVSQDATPGDGQGQSAGPIRLGGADAGDEGGGQAAGSARRCAAQRRA
jgi:hypothetical protein